MIDSRWVLVLLVAGSCTQSHDANRIAIRGDDCVTCHLADYDATTAPPHGMVPGVAGAQQFPTSCADCHRTTSWQPAVGGLHPPPPRFPIASGPHDAIRCLACHDLDLAASSTGGANTNCLQCHPDSADLRDSHTGVRSATGQSYAYNSAIANFCLTCHPAGLANKHPDARFPRTGPHDAPCTSCHDRASGVPDMAGMNTTCINAGCHSLTKTDGQHRENGARYTQIRGDGSNRHFCLDSRCHPDGRKHD